MGLQEILSTKSYRHFVYPISIDGYRVNWGDWDIIREFFSNALDAESNDWDKVKVEKTGTALKIHNTERALDIKDFYLGHSSQGKNINTAYIGRFNEGMKIAMIAALRFGYDLSIRFGKITAKPVATVTKDDVKILRVDLFKNKTSISGTEVMISGFKEDPLELISKNIIKPNDERIICELVDSFGMSYFSKPKLDDILQQRPQKNFQVLKCSGAFVAGMRVCDLNDYSCGYNVPPSVIKMPEGRNFIDTNDLNYLLQRSMQKIESKEYWQEIFRRVKAGASTKETMISLYTFAISDDAKKILRACWIETFGEDTVVEDRLSNEVIYRGGKTIKASPMLTVLSNDRIIPNSIEFLMRYNNAMRIFYKYEELSEKEKGAYSVLKSVVDKYAPGCEFSFYTSVEVEGEEGFYDPVKNLIGINRQSLTDAHNTIDTLLEEVTHAKYKTSDMERLHTDMIRNLASQWLLDEFVIKKTKELSDIYK